MSVQREKPDEWAMQAARNAVSTLPHLVEPNEEIPEIRVEDMVMRIEKAFPDRAAWNQAVHESMLDGEIKIWLLVP